MSEIIFIGNYKGGVGKTTTTINLANYFAQKGKKVLTLDLDPQSSLSEIQVSTHLSGETLNKIPDTETLNYIFELSILKISKYPSLKLSFSPSLIKKAAPNYYFIPSSLFYNKGTGLDVLSMRMENNIEFLSILKNYIDTIKEEFDFIIIDCPPSSNLITQSAFLLSDFYLIPTVLDKISTNGVVHYIHTVSNTYKEHCISGDDAMIAQHYFGACPKLIGVFYNMIRGQVDYTVCDSDFKRALSELEEKPYVFPSEINNYVDISRATEKGEVSKVKSDFPNLCEEILKRLQEIRIV